MNSKWAILWSLFVALMSVWLLGLSPFFLLPGIPLSSSIWCLRHLTGNKICHLRNVIYNSSSASFDFILSEDSIISGVESQRELQQLQLSSLQDHNRFFANISMVVSSSPSQCLNIDDPVIVIARFKPDNFMHVVHDDLMPLFATLEYLCGGDLNACRQQYTLLLLDGNVEGPFSNFYRLFAINVISASSIDGCLAVQELHIGLNLDTIWYQYGFKSPRGGIKSSLSAETLWRFRKFVLRKLLVPDSNTADQRMEVVIFSRSFSRKILNVHDIVKMVKSLYGPDVLYKVLDVRLENTQELIEEVSNAKLLIGVHGAEMILSIFLPSNSSVIEILPAGIPRSVSFLEPLKNISHFHYVPWSAGVGGVRHPEYLAHLGGLKHLPLQEQIRIGNIRSIREVRCCDDPAFLHLMYQDTKVGKSFENAILLSKVSLPAPPSTFSKWFFPGHVRELQCKIMEGAVLFKWSPPCNALGSEQFSVVIALDSRNVAFVVTEPNLSVKENVSVASAWVSAVFSNNSGPDSFVHCFRG